MSYLKRAQNGPDPHPDGAPGDRSPVGTAPGPAGRQGPPGGADRLILVGASTGGVTALEVLFADFPADCPPVAVAQHMPPDFLAQFARRLDDLIAPAVRLVTSTTPARPGHVHIACGVGDLTVRRAGGRAILVPVPSPVGAPYQPSVDVLFHSATSWGNRIVACILTGMGRDGADGLAALREAGAATFAQSADSCVVDGMPRAARECGAVGSVQPIGRLGPQLLHAAGHGVDQPEGRR